MVTLASLVAVLRVLALPSSTERVKNALVETGEREHDPTATWGEKVPKPLPCMPATSHEENRQDID